MLLKYNVLRFRILKFQCFVTSRKKRPSRLYQGQVFDGRAMFQSAKSVLIKMVLCRIIILLLLTTKSRHNIKHKMFVIPLNLLFSAFSCHNYTTSELPRSSTSILCVYKCYSSLRRCRYSSLRVTHFSVFSSLFIFSHSCFFFIRRTISVGC